MVTDADLKAFHHRSNGLIAPALLGAENAHHPRLRTCAWAATVALHHLAQDHRRPDLPFRMMILTSPN